MNFETKLIKLDAHKTEVEVKITSRVTLIGVPQIGTKFGTATLENIVLYENEGLELEYSNPLSAGGFFKVFKKFQYAFDRSVPVSYGHSIVESFGAADAVVLRDASRSDYPPSGGPVRFD